MITNIPPIFPSAPYSHPMITNIPWLQSALNWFLKEIFYYCFSQVFESYIFPNELLSFFILWFRPAFWYRDISMYLVLSAFTSSRISLLPTTKSFCLFLYIMYVSSQYINIISTNHTLICTFNFQPSCFTCTLLMTYCNTKFKLIATKHGLVLKFLKRKHVKQRVVYLNCTKDFIQTNVLDFLVSWGYKAELEYCARTAFYMKHGRQYCDKTYRCNSLNKMSQQHKRSVRQK